MSQKISRDDKAKTALAGIFYLPLGYYLGHRGVERMVLVGTIAYLICYATYQLWPRAGTEEGRRHE